MSLWTFYDGAQANSYILNMLTSRVNQVDQYFYQQNPKPRTNASLLIVPSEAYRMKFQPSDTALSLHSTNWGLSTILPQFVNHCLPKS